MSALGAPDTAVVTISDPVDAQGYCKGRDSLGKELRVQASLRPKGSPAPALGERWLVTKQGLSWLLDRMLDVPAPPAVEGALDPASALGSLVAGLADAGHVIDATTPPPAPVPPPWTGLALGASWAAYTTPVDASTPPAPGWSVSGGVVSLRGLATNAADAAASSVLATAPAAARPPHVRVALLAAEVSTTTTGVVRLDVVPSTGQILVIGAQVAGKILALDSIRWVTW